ncbi:Zinc finger, C2H2 [Penicillium italicum]|uniref:Zinc finger, C2H2 n=1 Tax=Penicillium italicum TaxID=40296 RepID=A0A0A2L5W1_PENIT|nr:Zinc finger, C2H2 [Penicillium italicum]
MHSAGWSLYAPSMNHASTSPHANWTMHSTVGPLTADNLHQSNLQSASTMEHKATEVGTEDHRSPGRTSSHTWSSAPSPSAQETTLSNEHNIEVADTGATSAHGNPPNQDESDGPFKCGWGGCTSRSTFSSHASLLRHVRVQHVAHRSVKCPECRQAFGRVDNMREHRGRRHQAFD